MSTSKQIAVLMFCLAFAGIAPASTFYINAAAGNDTNTGTEASHPWASLGPVNQHPFKPGDRILFRAGQSWTGVLEPHSSGTADNPIVLASYGEGAKPLFKGEGAEATLALREVSGWTVQDIAITNHGAKPANRVGVLIHTNGESSFIHLVRVDVSDVNGDVGSKSSGGIGVLAWGKNGETARFNDVLIDHCTLSHVDGQGIWFHSKNKTEPYPNTNIRITATAITDTGRNAIFLRDSLGALIDHNVIRFAAARAHGNAICIAWSKDTTVRDNEVSETGVHTGEHENGAIDVDDGALGTIVEYNWTHDNAGGAVNAAAQPGRDGGDDSGTILRYNLSENDGTHVFAVGGAMHNTLIYNNTAYVGKGHSQELLQAGQFTHYPQLPEGILFVRNVFFLAGKGSFKIAASNVLVDANCYLGRAPGNAARDKDVVIDKSPLHLANVPIQELRQAAQYRIPPGSACDVPGPQPPQMGERDLLGTPLNAMTAQMRGAIVSSPDEHP